MFGIRPNSAGLWSGDHGYVDGLAVAADAESLRASHDRIVEIHFGEGTALAPLFTLPDAPRDLLSHVLLPRGSRFRIRDAAPHDGTHRHVRLELLP